ncbi:MAG: hypothetical protein M3Y08_01660 [Fibrobacterota bacterium]|nr:hypothetical protein [Fibrobacterota bacterium]
MKKLTFEIGVTDCDLIQGTILHKAEGGICPGGQQKMAKENQDAKGSGFIFGPKIDICIFSGFCIRFGFMET